MSSHKPANKEYMLLKVLAAVVPVMELIILAAFRFHRDWYWWFAASGRVSRQKCSYKNHTVATGW